MKEITRKKQHKTLLKKKMAQSELELKCNRRKISWEVHLQ